jgi:hypothetical protein
MPRQVDSFLYQNNHYNGSFKPENLVFNANLQEFSQKIGFICSLETGGKLTPDESYQQIKRLWKDLKRSKKQLGIGKAPIIDEHEETEE